MRRLTTPEHRFSLGFSALKIKNLAITYKQFGRNILFKRLDDVSLDGEDIVIKLTQQETRRFTAGQDYGIYIHILTVDGESLVSDEITDHVYDSGDNEVLT